MRVIIATQAGELAMEVGLQEPVLEIKWRLQQALGIPISSFSLFVLGWELDGALNMADYPMITEGTKINLIIHKFQITIKFPAKQMTVEVDNTETVQSLKEKIHIINGTPIKRMVLYFSGMEMDEDFRGLVEYGVCHFSEIVVLLKTMACLNEKPTKRILTLVIEMSSTLLNAARVSVSVEESATISELGQLLLSSMILPADDYLFIHKQRIMRNNRSLHWHGVKNGDSVYVFQGTLIQGE